MRLSGKLVLTTAICSVWTAMTAAAALGQGDVTLGKPVIKRDGTARLPVTFSKPGTAVLWDASTLRPCGGPPRVQRVEVDVQTPETLTLAVKPTKLIKPDLKEGRKVKVPVQVQFDPQGANTGLPETHTIRIALRISSKAGTAAVRRCTPPAPYESVSVPAWTSPDRR
jgi:hypothetical protein